MIRGLIIGFIWGAIVYGIIGIFVPISFIQAAFMGGVIFGIVGITLGLPGIRLLRLDTPKFFQFLLAALAVSAGGFLGVLIQIPTQTTNLMEPFLAFYGASSMLRLFQNGSGRIGLIYLCAFLGLFLTIVIDMILKMESLSSGLTGWLSNAYLHKIQDIAISRFLNAQTLEQASRWEEAVGEYDKAALLCKRLKIVVMEAFVRGCQARVLRNTGQLKQGLDYVAKADQLLEEARDDWTKRYVQMHLQGINGTLCQKLPRGHEKAIGYFKETIRLGMALLNELESQPQLINSLGFLILPDLRALRWVLTHGIAVGKTNQAEMLLRGEEADRKKADELADDVMAVGRDWNDYKLEGAACRIKGEISEYRARAAEKLEEWKHYLHEAADCYEKALDFYLNNSLSFPDVRAVTLNALRRVQRALSLWEFKQEGEPDGYPKSEKVPEKIVLRDKPFLSGIEELAILMPLNERWKLYLDAAMEWDDAGWRDRFYQYLVKAVECLDNIRASLPLVGEFLAEQRTEFMQRAQVLLQGLVGLLLSPTEGGKTGVHNRVAEAFLYREKFGPTALLDELEIANCLGTGKSISKRVGGQQLEFEDLVAGRVARLEDIQRILPDNTVLIEYVLTDSLFVGLVITKDTVSVPIYENAGFRGHEPSINPRDVAQRVREFLHAIGHEVDLNGEPTYSGFPQQMNLTVIRDQAQWLYNALLSGTENSWWQDGKVKANRLVVIPHGVLHRLPFCTLYDGNEFLVEKIPVVQCPSASVLRYCYEKRPKVPVRVTYFGCANPLGNTPNWKEYRSIDPNGIWGCEKVVLDVAQKFGFQEDWVGNYIGQNGGDVFGVRREASTWRALLENVSHYAIVDIETHGKFEKDGEFPDGSLLNHRFLVVGDDGEPCWFTAREVFLYLRMQPELLVAAMCHSGRVEIPTGDETVGLLRAFLFAGCRSILVYPWVLVDDVAEALMLEFYACLIRRDSRGKPYLASMKDVALQSAQVQIITRGRQGDSFTHGISKVSWEHPYYWGWTLIGDHA